MTRINTIDPQHLLDQHLMAEYREITRVSSLSKHCTIPRCYVMGTGHVKFFYDKGLFLANRRIALLHELERRGYAVNWFEYVAHLPSLHKDWQPTSTDHSISLQRLDEKLRAKPTFYTFNKTKVQFDHYSKLKEFYKCVY